MLTKTLLMSAVAGGLLLAGPSLASDEQTFPGTPPSTWAGSNGVRQPTGFEISGFTNYEMVGGAVKQIQPADTRSRDYYKRHDFKGGSTGGTPGSNP